MVPNHIAIILDGNGRWAKAKGLPRTAGHTAGAKNVEVISEACGKLGVKYLTLYAFSTENWKRPEEEVNALMSLLDNYLDSIAKSADKYNIRVRVIGDKTGLSEKLQKKIQKAEEITSVHDGLNLSIAINYGSRDEILRAVKKVAQDVADTKLSIDSIDGDCFSSYLDTKDLPDPDLMIRTSGEQRLSNYLLWQLAYSEFYFTPVAWPDFNEAELKKAIEEYENRNRRFGGV